MRFRGKFKQELPGFQIAPMVDVIFNLMCLLLVGQIFAKWETEVDVKLPTSQTGTNLQRLPGEIIINVLKDGTVIVNKKTLDQAGLRDVLKKIVEQFPSQPVLIRADKETAYGHVIRVLDVCRQSDIWNVSFATSMPEGS